VVIALAGCTDPGPEALSRIITNLSSPIRGSSRLWKKPAAGAHTVELLVQSRVWTVAKLTVRVWLAIFAGEYQVWAESGCG
jgi:hypothetical protein